MRAIRITGCAVILATALLAPRLHAAMSFVVNAENTRVTSLNHETLESIYLGKKTLWDDGQRITPVLLNEESQTSKEFIETIIGKTLDQYRAYWRKRLFSGGGAVPKTFRSSAAVVEFVAHNPGAIGIIETASPDGRVRIVNVTK